MLAIAASANGRVNLNAALSRRASQRAETGRSRDGRRQARPAIASISVSDMGIEALTPVVVAMPRSTTNRRIRSIAHRDTRRAARRDNTNASVARLPSSQSGGADNLRAGTDADDDRSSSRWLLIQCRTAGSSSRSMAGTMT